MEIDMAALALWPDSVCANAPSLAPDALQDRLCLVTAIADAHAGSFEIGRTPSGEFCCILRSPAPAGQADVVAFGYGDTASAAWEDAHVRYMAKDPAAERAKRIARLKAALALAEAA
jgi:hypothetical protein